MESRTETDATIIQAPVVRERHVGNVRSDWPLTGWEVEERAE